VKCDLQMVQNASVLFAKKLYKALQVSNISIEALCVSVTMGPTADIRFIPEQLSLAFQTVFVAQQATGRCFVQLVGIQWSIWTVTLEWHINMMNIIHLVESMSVRWSHSPHSFSPHKFEQTKI
jgi:hypothetical protein